MCTLSHPPNTHTLILTHPLSLSLCLSPTLCLCLRLSVCLSVSLSHTHTLPPLSPSLSHACGCFRFRIPGRWLRRPCHQRSASKGRQQAWQVPQPSQEKVLLHTRISWGARRHHSVAHSVRGAQRLTAARCARVRGQVPRRPLLCCRRPHAPGACTGSAEQRAQAAARPRAGPVPPQRRPCGRRPGPQAQRRSHSQKLFALAKHPAAILSTSTRSCWQQRWWQSVVCAGRRGAESAVAHSAARGIPQ